MAYVSVGQDKMWRAPSRRLKASRIIRVGNSDTPYVAMDFKDKLVVQESAISATAAVTEVDSKTITIADVSVDPNNQIVSMKVSGWTATGDYTLNVPVTLSDGTTNVISAHGTIRVVAD